MLDLAKELYNQTKKNTENGIVTKNVSDLLMDAYLAVSFDSAGKNIKFKNKTFEKVVEMFTDSDAELYYNELRRNTGKTVISQSMMDKAESTVDLLKNNFVTYELFSDREDVDVFEQEAIEFQIEGEDFKSLPDHFEVHHKTKEIVPFDRDWETIHK